MCVCVHMWWFFKIVSLILWILYVSIKHLWLTTFYLFLFLQEVITESAPLRCRKLSNPDIFASAGKTKIHRQLSQDDCKLRRGSVASSLSGMPFGKDRVAIH